MNAGQPRIDVVGLGPGGGDLITAGTLEVIAQAEHRYVRTDQHPSSHVARASSFDHHYESHNDFESVYACLLYTSPSPRDRG